MDDPCPCPRYSHTLLPPHDSSHTNTNLLDSGPHTHWSHSNHSRSSAMRCAHASRPSTNFPASRSEWGWSRSSNWQRGCSSRLRYPDDLSSSRCSSEGIRGRGGWWCSFAVMRLRARGVMPARCWTLNARMLGEARWNRLGLGRVARMALS